MMLKKLIEVDEILKELVKRSSLTEVQWDTLLLNKSKDYSLEEKCRMRDVGKVTKGSFLRSYSQALDNCIKAIFTLITLDYLGLIKVGSIEGLARVSEMLESVKGEEIDKDRVKAIIESLERIVKEMVS
ncbi:hypothetical protein HRbin06_00426 [archaeon HR06]|nr:hypothetical protein HRbin06_00426 [archaeon HR06]